LLLATSIRKQLVFFFSEKIFSQAFVAFVSVRSNVFEKVISNNVFKQTLLKYNIFPVRKARGTVEALAVGIVAAAIVTPG